MRCARAEAKRILKSKDRSSRGPSSMNGSRRQHHSVSKRSGLKVRVKETRQIWSFYELMCRFRRGEGSFFQEDYHQAEAEIEECQHDEGIAICHHHRLAVNKLGQLLQCHQSRVAGA